jgi:hypothetical protein
MFTGRQLGACPVELILFRHSSGSNMRKMRSLTYFFSIAINRRIHLFHKSKKQHEIDGRNGRLWVGLLSAKKRQPTRVYGALRGYVSRYLQGVYSHTRPAFFSDRRCSSSHFSTRASFDFSWFPFSKTYSETITFCSVPCLLRPPVAGRSLAIPPNGNISSFKWQRFHPESLVFEY